LSIGGALPSPLVFPREVSLLAQSHLEEDQEQGCAETERDECDGQRIARRPADQGGADHTGDDKRRGGSKAQDARAGRHLSNVSRRPRGGAILIA